MNKIKELIRKFGILVISAIWPEKRKRGLQKLGIIALVVMALLGVSRASAIQEMLLGKRESNPVQTKQAAAVTQTSLNTPSQPAAEDTTETASTTAAPNIVDLIADSETIFRGQVTEVTDGFENGVPYTQVTMVVSETLRGDAGEEYTFRQFGLKEPRSMGNGKVYLGTTPEGWSKYAVGDDAMMFMYQRASMTGLQTTVGLGQGKVMFKGGNAISQAGNEGLFENVEVNAGLLNDKDKRLLATKKGAVNAEGFQSFVRRAVKNKWVEGGKMRHAKK